MSCQIMKLVGGLCINLMLLYAWLVHCVSYSSMIRRQSLNRLKIIVSVSRDSKWPSEKYRMRLGVLFYIIIQKLDWDVELPLKEYPHYSPALRYFTPLLPDFLMSLSMSNIECPFSTLNLSLDVTLGGDDAFKL